MERVVLSVDGAEVPLRPKFYDVLAYLVHHAGRLVTRQELMRALWPGLIVTDDSLTQCLKDIRRALGDDRHEIIRTAPRRGYVFEIPVEARTGQAHPEGWQAKDESGAVHRRRGLNRIFLAVGALVVVALVAWWLITPSRTAPAQTPASHSPAKTQAAFEPPALSIAVLPFVDLSPAGDHEYLADGISEEILNLLTGLPQLTVIARTSSFAFKHTALTLGEIARRLKVAHVLEGSVRIEGDTARVTAQLVAAQTEVHLWSQTFDFPLDGVFVLQNQVANEVAQVLGRQLGIEQSPSRVTAAVRGGNPRAWDHVLRGRFFYGRRADGDLQRALREFDLAIATDDALADAWVGRASTLKVLADSGVDGYRRDDPAIVAAIERAIVLDQTNPEALIRMATHEASVGRIEQFWHHLDLAIRYGRNSALVQSMLAGLALLASDVDRAVVLQRRAVELDPLGAVNWGNLTHYLCIARRFEEADLAARRTVELSPDVGATTVLAKIALLRGDNAAAQELAEQWPEGPERWFVLTVTEYRAGNLAESGAMMTRLRESGDAPRTLQLVAMAQAERGETDAAFDALAAATEAILIRNGETSIEWPLLEDLRSSPSMDSLRADPRWSAWVDDYRHRLIAVLGWDAAELFRRHPQLGQATAEQG